eukprot:CAMPEP_0118896442 /NCGR_PEP_ID=MMETSP1166-20130328/4310_1 /TAXON_ID=1104430 /ORGANISM="Chrysoreinhardia sp, Strain CCMP3193" /LENGTH=164 /DNA_ID=CAMNT_0006835501 /DNA_START=34 /DNA_END=528 /DNA_ORIENTATION=+
MPVFGLTLLCLFALVAEGLVGPPFGGDGIDPKVFRDRDPYRPPQGSPAPKYINAIVIGQTDDEVVARLLREMDILELKRLVFKAVATNSWICDNFEEDQYGIPMDSLNPFINMARAECMLALHLLIHYPPDGVVPATDDSPPLKVADFIDKDRLKVLRSVLPPK